MRKFLIIILLILIWGLGVMFVMDGVSIGNFEVLSVEGVQDLNNTLDTKIYQATDLVESKFPSENDKLNTALKKAETLRVQYENFLKQYNSEDISEILKTERYEIEKLWISIGNYADEHDVKVNIQVTSSSSGIVDVKDLNFTVNGKYVDITDFIYELEDDEELTFKIENFYMLPDVEDKSLKATFTVKDVNVNISGITKVPVKPADDKQESSKSDKESKSDSTNSKENVENAEEENRNQ